MAARSSLPVTDAHRATPGTAPVNSSGSRAPLAQSPATVPELSERLRVLEAERERQEERIAELQRAVANLLESHALNQSRVDERLAQVHRDASRANQQVNLILNSRTWKALVSMGGVALRASSLWGRAAGPRRARQPSSAPISITCDDPAPDARQRVSGVLPIRGWALAEAGVQRVEIQAAGLEPVAARHGLYRPDVGQHFPANPDAERAGFRGALDLRGLPNGRHTIVLRVLDGAGRSAETSLTVTVDHTHGFASPYARWIHEFERRDEQLIRLKLQSFRLQPKVSVLVPVYRTHPTILAKTIESVRRQSYPHWELCLADDHSQSPAVDALLASHDGDPRIAIVRLPRQSGISAATNAALQVSTGEWVALLDHDDELAQDALYHMVDAINERPRADVLYSDEDHIDAEGVRSDPFFKPDWSPHLILSENYVCHLLMFRRELALAVGGFRPETDLSQDHDILLRLSQQAREIVHVPHVLYHWRTDVDGVSRASTREVSVLASSRRVVEGHLQRLGIGATVEEGRVPSRWRVRYPVPRDARVSIIVPSGGKVDQLHTVLTYLSEKTEHRDFEVVVVDNSRGDEVQHLLAQWRRSRQPVRSLDMRGLPFNFSLLNNRAASTCDSRLLLFLNDDTAAIEPGWLTALVELAAQPSVGAVGAKLLYPDNTIQHAGVVMGVLGSCGHAFRRGFHDQRSYFDLPDVIRDVSALTAACLMVPRSVFQEVGGFNETDFPVAYQDVDLCLRIREAGYHVLYTPHALLHHFEAKTKTAKDIDPKPEEVAALKRKWARYIEADPFYNPHLTRAAEDFSLRCGLDGNG